MIKAKKAPKSGLVIPSLSKASEAEWFDRNRDKIEADIGRRIRVGDTKTLDQALSANAVKERKKLKPVTIRMMPDDLLAARELAERKGMPYQTYIKVLLRHALQRETRKLG